MLVGIGFIAVLTGALAQRFLARDVRAIEAGIAGETESMENILDELRAVRNSLGDLEARLQRLGAASQTMN